MNTSALELLTFQLPRFTLIQVHLSFRPKNIKNQGWDKKQRTNDIAVIRLERPVQFNHKIQPACLPNKDSCFPAGTACVASGWGYIEEGGPRSNLLREVAVRLMTTDHCNKPGYYNGKILEGMLCAGYNEGARDACTGNFISI